MKNSVFVFLMFTSLVFSQNSLLENQVDNFDDSTTFNDNWTSAFYGGTTGTQEISTESVYEGTGSLKVVADMDHAHGIRIVSNDNIGMLSGVTYNFDVYIEAAIGGQVDMTLLDTSNSNSLVKKTTITVSLTGFNKYTLTYTPTVNYAHVLSFQIRFKIAGTYYVDYLTVDQNVNLTCVDYGNCALNFDPSTVTKPIGTRMGLNMNYLTDHDANRATGSRSGIETYADFKPGMLRYPGGEKSDSHRFCESPYDTSDPQAYNWYPDEGEVPNNVYLGFDDYMSYINSVGAIPYLVVAYDPGYNYDPNSVQTVEEAVEHAIGWVTYANITQGYDVKYWEIGNENYTNTSGMDKDEVAADVATIAAAMKAVDPTIKIGCSIKNQEWIDAMYAGAGQFLDFYNLSHYLSYSSYDEYLSKTGDYTLIKSKAIQARASADASVYNSQMEVIASECGIYNSFDPSNNMGNTIIIADLLGNLLADDSVDYFNQWNTRWIYNEGTASKYDMLDNLNTILNTGQPLRVYNNMLLETIGLLPSGVSVPNSIRTYVSTDSSGNVSLFILNRGSDVETIDINFTNSIGFLNGKFYSLSGANEFAISTSWTSSSVSYDADNDKVSSLVVPAYSFSVLEMRAVAGVDLFDPTITNNQNEELLSTSKDFKLEGIGMFPNPVDDYVEITLPFSEEVNLELISISGKVLLKKNLVSGEKLNMSSFAQGLYILKISSNKGVASLKLLKK